MGTVRADTITDGAGTGAPDFTNGLQASGGVIGSDGTADASIGHVGEYYEDSRDSGAFLDINSTTAVDLISISLTAGDWDVYFNFGVSGLCTDSDIVAKGAISTVSGAKQENQASYAMIYFDDTNGAFIDETTMVYRRIKITSTTTIYCVGWTDNQGDQCRGWGKMYCRRAR